MLNYKSLIVFLFLTLSLIYSCKDEITSSQRILSAKTNKTVYETEEKIIISINNSLDRKVFLQKCGDRLYPYMEKLDSSWNGWVSFTAVCRNITEYEFQSNVFYSDTVQTIYTGRYRIRYFYSFENIDPRLYRDSLFTNEFIVK